MKLLKYTNSNDNMISWKLRRIFLISILVFVVHGTEEYITSFYTVDHSYLYLVEKLQIVENQELVFILYQLGILIALLLIAIFVRDRLSTLMVYGLIGIFMLLEVQHIIESIIQTTYYPGAISSFIFLIIAYYFWKEWFKEIKRYHNNT